MTHPTEHRTPARLTASPHGHAREGSARPRLPPAPGGPWGRPTLVTPSPTAGARELSPSSGVSCGEKTSPSAARTGAGGGWQGSVGSPLGQADLISQQPFPWEPATTIHTLGNAGKGGQGSVGRGAWAASCPAAQGSSIAPSSPRQGLAGVGGLPPRGAGTQGQGGDSVQATEPPPPTPGKSPPGVCIFTATQDGVCPPTPDWGWGAAVPAPRPAASRRFPGCLVFCRHGATVKDNLCLVVGDISGGFRRKLSPPLPQSCPPPPPAGGSQDRHR